MATGGNPTSIQPTNIVVSRRSAHPLEKYNCPSWEPKELIVEPDSDDPPFELDRFELVLLKRPAELATIPDDEVDRLQDLHIAHLQAMAKTGAIRVAGPFDEQRDQSLRGMAL